MSPCKAAIRLYSGLKTMHKILKGYALMEHLRFSIGGSSAEGRTLNVYWYTSQAHRRNRSTDLSDIVWIGGCKRLHLFICDEREITEKKPSLGYIGMSATSGKHEL